MVSEAKLIKIGIKYSDQFFEQLKKIYGDAFSHCDSLEEFLNETKDYSISNPLETSGYKDQMVNLIVSSTNNIKYSRPAQKALMQTIIRNTTGELIVDVGDDIKDGVRDIVNRGYREGKLNHVRVANEINTELDGINHKRARTIARTEIKRAQTTSNYVIAKERGANAYKYKCGATPCDICKKDCGKTFPIDDLEHLPPRHPNCMCGVTFFVDPNLPKNLEREPETVEPTRQNASWITEDFLKEKLSETDYKNYKLAKSNMRFSKSLLERGGLDEKGIQIHKQTIEHYSKQINELTDKALNNPTKKSTSPTEKPTNYMINHDNSFSDVKITEKQFKHVVNHQNKRANAQLEFGNSIDNATGELIHSKDIRGKKNKVFIPTSNKPYSVIHNHTNNGGFSGGDAYSHLTGLKQEVCYATTPKGIWIMRDTSFGTFRKEGGGVSDSIAYEIQYKMEGKFREFANEAKTKYQSSLDNVKSNSEREDIRTKLNEECFENYNNWLLEEFAVGKRRDYEFEIEFIPMELIEDVQF